MDKNCDPSSRTVKDAQLITVKDRCQDRNTKNDSGNPCQAKPFDCDISSNAHLRGTVCVEEEAEYGEEESESSQYQETTYIFPNESVGVKFYPDTNAKNNVTGKRNVEYELYRFCYKSFVENLWC